MVQMSGGKRNPSNSRRSTQRFFLPLWILLAVSLYQLLTYDDLSALSPYDNDDAIDSHREAKKGPVMNTLENGGEGDDDSNGDEEDDVITLVDNEEGHDVYNKNDIIKGHVDDDQDTEDKDDDDDSAEDENKDGDIADNAGDANDTGDEDNGNDGDNDNNGGDEDNGKDGETDDDVGDKTEGHEVNDQDTEDKDDDDDSAEDENRDGDIADNAGDANDTGDEDNGNDGANDNNGGDEDNGKDGETDDDGGDKTEGHEVNDQDTEDKDDDDDNVEDENDDKDGDIADNAGDANDTGDEDNGNDGDNDDNEVDEDNGKDGETGGDENDGRNVENDKDGIKAPSSLGKVNSKPRKSSQESDSPKYLPLQCEQYGGPKDDISSEMVYWMDIPSDATYRNPFQRLHSSEGEEKFATFEPDIGGWNNIRMSMETVITLAISMGRTVVLPPEQSIYLMDEQAKKQKRHFTIRDFYNLEAIEIEHIGLKFISMSEFLERVAMKGKLIDRRTGQVSYPPGNRTDWNKVGGNELWAYLREAAYDEMWNPMNSIAFFPKKVDPSQTAKQRIDALFHAQVGTDSNKFINHPVAVNASVDERLREHMAGRDKLCLYNKTMQDAPDIHFRADDNIRFLAPFYTFAFFEDWRQGTWTKRFIRDHIRYSDDIVCAAARVVGAVRQIAKERDPIGNPDGSFDTLHIRRNDFKSQYEDMVRSCEELYEYSKDKLKPNSTIFIATDEYDQEFFGPFKEKYNVLFLSDFKGLLNNTNSNYFGFIDQLVAARGNIFFGTFLSTFSAYINRMRGYYSVRDHLDGYKEGQLQSFYFYPEARKNEMTVYAPITGAFWMKAFPVGWRDINRGIGELPHNN